VGRLKIGVLGGTFDPVHLGHLVLAEEACYHLELHRVLWVLTPDPPHKTGKTMLKWDDRWRLLNLAVAGNSAFELSNVDILRPPPYYALDTMCLLKEKYPGDQLIYLIGSDSLRDLPGWYHPGELVEVCDGFGVMMRPGVPVDDQRLEKLSLGIRQKLIFISALSLDISSSDIRARIAHGKPYRYLLPPAEYDYIHENHLYLPISMCKHEVFNGLVK
jgi:nicotinate-nucleotide adenylyltransferase